MLAGRVTRLASIPSTPGAMCTQRAYDSIYKHAHRKVKGGGFKDPDCLAVRANIFGKEGDPIKQVQASFPCAVCWVGSFFPRVRGMLVFGRAFGLFFQPSCFVQRVFW
jgi:hypothetical protein